MKRALVRNWPFEGSVDQLLFGYLLKRVACSSSLSNKLLSAQNISENQKEERRNWVSFLNSQYTLFLSLPLENMKNLMYGILLCIQLAHLGTELLVTANKNTGSSIHMLNNHFSPCYSLFHQWFLLLLLKVVCSHVRLARPIHRWNKEICRFLCTFCAMQSVDEIKTWLDFL